MPRLCGTVTSYASILTMSQRKETDVVPADPTKWDEKSQRSVAFEFVQEYKDILYNCWHCTKPYVFTASDQKYTYEVKKANINQCRILCTDCWRESLHIAKELKVCEEQWATSKAQLRYDKVFLAGWLELLTRLELYVPYKHDTARKNMLRQLTADA